MAVISLANCDLRQSTPGVWRLVGVNGGRQYTTGDIKGVDPGTGRVIAHDNGNPEAVFVVASTRDGKSVAEMLRPLATRLPRRPTLDGAGAVSSEHDADRGQTPAELAP
ncbi:MAG: hypothetical protein JKP92_05540 [Alphaproteobacteria bacterium]|jgi:hypothetical protein|nr:hypothetical protein [Alphaproteobacteria bacterium]